MSKILVLMSNIRQNENKVLYNTWCSLLASLAEEVDENDNTSARGLSCLKDGA
jgi:hypothetical protein